MSIAVNGNLIVTPQAVVTVDDSGYAAPTIGGSGDVIIVGASQGGQPLVPIYFRTPAEAARMLIGGDGLRGVLRAFSPAPNFPGAPRVIFVRANVGTQATVTINDATGHPSVVLTAQDYGSQTNLIRVNVAAGTTIGRKISIAYNGAVYVKDNLNRDGMTITYTGTNNPVMAIGPVTTATPATTIAAAVTAGTAVSAQVASSTGMVIGSQYLVGYQGTATAEVVTATATADGTHFTATFANAHAIGEPVVLYNNQTGLAIDVTTSGAVQVPAECIVLPFSQFTTVQSIADALNGKSSLYTAVVNTPNPADPSTSFDGITAGTAVSKTTGTDLTENLYACLLALNDNAQTAITATAASGANQPPAIFASPTQWTYLAGAVDGNNPPSATDWTNALAAAATVDCSIITVASGNATVHAQLQTHVDFESSLVERNERIGIVGGVAGETTSQAIARANSLRDMRMGLVFPGIVDYDPVAPGTTPIVLDPWLVACQLAGMFCGGPIQDALTNRYIAARGLELALGRSDVENLEQNGIIPIRQIPRNGWAVAHSLSTDIADSNYRRNELSVMRGSDYVTKQVRAALDPLVGRVASPGTMLQVYNTTKTTLQDLTKQGILVGDASSPSFSGLSVTVNGDVVYVNFNASVAIPANYIVCTIALTPYSGSLSS